MSMMKLYAGMFCFLFPLASFAQSKIGYIYDDVLALPQVLSLVGLS